MEKAIKLSVEVANALKAGKPVVALESTIISHGLPRPSNLNVAREVEAIVREHGATPATIAILDGVVHIGVDAELARDLQRLLDDLGRAELRVLEQGDGGRLRVGAAAADGDADKIVC